MKNLKFKSAEMHAESRNLRQVFIQKKQKLGYKSIYDKKWRFPKMIEIDGERFDHFNTENTQISGKKYYYSNVTRFACNHKEGVEPKTAIFW